MFKIISILHLLILSIVFGQYDYNLEDLNSSSQFYGQEVGTSTFPEKVSVHYFGHYNWGLCTARFGELNDFFVQWTTEGLPVQLIGVGKDSHLSSLGNWVDSNDVPVCADTSPFSTWSAWGAAQRDLFILDHEGNVVFQENISSGLPSSLNSLINELVNAIPDDSILGDTNSDGVLNVLDVVSLVNLVLNNSSNDLADMNADGTLNVLDVVLLVSIILG